ncbi:hypothetical protein GXW83_02605 [Streptacidiphilus sp. PB12-B1b]|uniref:hypothetical protein n=1 Tax=Streptacidiphilus sp. PB12-B1b TaxID=2705012 RepID=UPI0015FAF124|nr:hypothetical protein [Streptacidiphilus sp. PB12-B1b]QMU74828.1 hypothetical protein GXW83_02605 [Streptacidiphilus sp. PB12-B1b]
MLERTTVSFAREGKLVTARIDGPRLPLSPSPRSQVVGWVPQITAALRSRGLPSELEDGISATYIHAPLPEGRKLVITPPQEPAEEQPPGAWVALAEREGEPGCEMWWDSQTTGPDHAHLGIAPLLAAVDRRLDDLGVAQRPDPRPVLNEVGTHPSLYRAGFVPVEAPTGRFFRLPLAMADPDGQHRAVTRAVESLRFEGFGVRCPPQLLSDDPRALHLNRAELFGLGQLPQFVRDHALHTRDVVGALDEFASPLDGMLAQAVETLHAAADWWQDLDGPDTERHVYRLHLMATQIERSTEEVRALRGELADRHTDRPLLPRAGARAVRDDNSSRAQAARSVSPSARHTPPTGTPPSAQPPASQPPPRHRR